MLEVLHVCSDVSMYDYHSDVIMSGAPLGRAWSLHKGKAVQSHKQAMRKQWRCTIAFASSFPEMERSHGLMQPEIWRPQTA